MKPLLPVLVAGGTFAGAAVIGLLGGIAADRHFNQPLLVPAGLLLGAAVGGLSALRLIVRSIR
ncbi:MAG: AtpZ/AtpI family protein [Candidatus Cybelea sp.]